MRVPTIVAGAVMPDACPSGVAAGTIPVGGVVACEDAIHPGIHSADICCSMAISVFPRKDDPERVLDAVQDVTHFGPGGRRRGLQIAAGRRDVAAFRDNPFLQGLGAVRDRAFRHAGRRQPFRLCRHLKSTGADGAGHASRLARPRRAALQGAWRWPKAYRDAVAGDPGAQCLDPGVDTRRRPGLLGGAADDPRMDQGQPYRASTISRPRKLRRTPSPIASGTSTTSSSGARTGCSTTARARRRPGRASRPTMTDGP